MKKEVKRCFLEAATTLPVGLYIGLYPFFKVLKKSQNLSERWYSFIFTIVYAWGEKPIREMKTKVFEDLTHGRIHSMDKDHEEKRQLRVLEIGPGFGGNFKYYPENTLLTTVEINNYLEEHIEDIKKLYPNVHLVKSINGNAENMSQVPDNSVDVVVGTLILCCIDNPLAALKEINRVLAPGGRFFFLENVQHPEHTFKKKLQKAWTPFWRGFTLRCKSGTFDAVAEIRKVFEAVDEKEMTIKDLPALLSRFQYGVAIKS